jgi:hypothetical protein
LSGKDRRRVGQDGETEDGKRRELRRVQTVSSGQGQEDSADDSDTHAQGSPADEVDRRGRYRYGAMDGLGCRRPSNEEIDERRHDAVIQSALNVQQAPHSRWDTLVLHNGSSESGIGRGDDCGNGSSHPDPTAAEQPERDGSASSNGQWQPDHQQADRQVEVAMKPPCIYSRRIGEEHQGQGDFRQGADVGRGQSDVDEFERSVCRDDPEHHERNRSRDVPAFKAA